MKKNNDPLLTSRAIAARLAITQRTLRRMIVRGEFPGPDTVLGYNMHRWRPQTLERWLAERE